MESAHILHTEKSQFSWNYIECTKSCEGDEAKDVGLVCAERKPCICGVQATRQIWPIRNV